MFGGHKEARMPKHPHPTVTQLQVIIGLAERIHSEVEAIPAVYTGRSRHLRASPATIARNQAAEYIERAGDLLAKARDAARKLR